MSRDDLERWDKRYTEGSYRSRTWPSPFLSRYVPELGLGRGAAALDIACGLGRNARYLAGEGFAVTGQDISRVALDQARAIDRGDGLNVDYVQADFDVDLPDAQSFALISCIRFMNRNLHTALADALIPGGWLLFEHHVRTDQDVSGPPNSFRLAPNELLSTYRGLRVRLFEEGIEQDKDGRTMALSRIVAQKT